MSDVTRILQSIDSGDSKAAEELLPLVYEELRRLAAAKMANEAPGQTLQPTALVHEAWLRLTGEQHTLWANRGHFFSAAAEAMRRILIEAARRKSRLKRGGHMARLDWEEADLFTLPPENLLALNEALEKLAAQDAQGAELIKLRFFAGLTQVEAAKALDVPLRTADRILSFARAWLYREIYG